MTTEKITLFNQIAEDFLKERYFKDGEGWDEMCARVAHFHANDDDEFYKYLKMLYECKGLPNSPTLMNSGTEAGFLSACNLIPVPDSLDGIMDAVKASAMISQAGGGCGFNFSSLRPTGDVIKTTGGKSSGAVSFLKVFDVTSTVIKQGGKRRSANLGLLRYDHPDILRWIHAKDVDGDISTFNLSIGLDDEFFCKVERGAEIVFINPRDKKPFPAYDPVLKIERNIMTARDLLHRIARAMWSTGEPGILFWDTIQSKNTTPSLGKLQGTNPCVTGDTLIAVADGRDYVPIRLLAKEGGPIPVYAFDGKRVKVVSAIAPRKTGENVDVYEVKLDDGSVIRATENHRFMLRDGSYVEVKDLKSKDSLMPFNRWEYSPQGKPTKYWAIGTNERTRRWLSEHRMIAEFYHQADGKIVHHRNFDGQDNSFDNLEFLTKEEHDTKHDISGDKNPMRFWWDNASEEERDAYRKKMSISTSGERNGTYGLERTEEWISRIKKGQERHRREHGYALVKHICPFCKKEIEIKPSEFRARKKNNIFGVFCSKSCAQKFRFSVENHRVVSVKHIGKQDVYNLTVPDGHNYAVVTNPESKTRIKGYPKQSGIFIRNCGETGLYDWESCCLGSINLFAHLKESPIGLTIDFGEIDKTARTMVKMLNSIIDKNKYPVSGMRDAAIATRKIGLGVMGLADTLAIIGITYGSDESLMLIREIMMQIQWSAMDESMKMAEEHGSYPSWASGDGPERRNGTTTSIAPTGSISFIAGVSSGIEPIFKMAYQMNREDKEPIIMVAESFRRALEKHGKTDVLSMMLSEKMTPRDLVEKGLLPDSFKHFITASEVSPSDHVRVQSVVQEYVDMSISKTINMPYDTTIEQITDIIKFAYQKECKGMTVFRDGCFRDAFLTEIKCSSCGSIKVEHKEGCMTCSDCGMSLCSVG